MFKGCCGRGTVPSESPYLSDKFPRGLNSQGDKTPDGLNDAPDEAAGGETRKQIVDTQIAGECGGIGATAEESRATADNKTGEAVEGEHSKNQIPAAEGALNGIS